MQHDLCYANVLTAFAQAKGQAKPDALTQTSDPWGYYIKFNVLKMGHEMIYNVLVKHQLHYEEITMNITEKLDLAIKLA